LLCHPEAERFCFGWDDLDWYLQFIKSHLNRSFGIWDEDCCGDWRWDLCRTTTNITRTYINSPNNHPSPLMQDAKRPSFWWKERPPSTTPRYYANAGRMVMGFGSSPSLWCRVSRSERISEVRYNFSNVTNWPMSETEGALTTDHSSWEGLSMRLISGVVGRWGEGRHQMWCGVGQDF
jgi:hypothetical protein